jgi:hypothetical protein
MKAPRAFACGAFPLLSILVLLSSTQYVILSMKSIFTLLLALCTGFSQLLFAQQAPQKFNYQAVARDGEGLALSEKPLTVRIGILSDTDLDRPLYSEEHTVVTNRLGLFNVAIGTGRVIEGSFSSIDWGSAAHYIHVRMDMDGSGRFVDLGQSQLLSVPYALYAEKSGLTTGMQGDGSRNDPDDWSRTGNGGTNPSVNFIGTTDAQDLVVRTNGTERARFKTNGDVNLSTGSNITIGNSNALNMDGTRNIHIGENAGAISTGDQNAFIGYNAGQVNTTGAKNTFIGPTAGRINTTGSQNAFIGGRAGFNNTTGGENSFIGWQAGQQNVSGNENTFIGKYAGSSNTTGSLNTYIGSNSGGSANLTNATAIGAGAQVTVSNSLVLGNNANVGIGVSAPDQRLHIAGNARITGAIFDSNNEAGTAGQVLSSTATGTQWITPDEGGGTLDAAYDFGGDGVGRTITADAGAVRISGTDGLLVKGQYGVGAVPGIEGALTAMYFNPYKSAFRAGSVYFGEWDGANVGNFSVAMGQSTIAYGHFSTALGLGTVANTYAETALGTYGTIGNSAYNVTFNSNDRLLTLGNGINADNRSDALRVLKNGNTAIGNIDPTTRLDVDGQIRIRGGAPGAGKILVSDAIGLASWADFVETDPKVGVTLSGTVPRWDGSTLVNGILADNGSNVGVGTTTPSAKLEVNGQIKITGGSPEASKVLVSDANGLASWAFEADPKVDVTLVGSIPRWNGSNLANGSMTDNGSNVGVGTTTPTATLEVNGQIKITGGSPGASKVLVSDANGLAAWQIAQLSLDQAYDYSGSGTGRTIVADAGAVRISGTDGILVTGTFSSGNNLDASGAGVKMFFFPKFAAFRVGQVNGNHWDEGEIGEHSFASGNNTRAKGSISTAIGFGCSAMAFASLAGIYNSTASGLYSIALGSNASASSTNSIALGNGASSSGSGSIALGPNNSTGDNSTALGGYTLASGEFSISTGRSTIASGDNSSAMGNQTIAPSFAEIALGILNTEYTPSSTSNYSSSDRLLVVGNGTSTSNRSDAMVILKNGNTGIGTSTPQTLLHLNGTDPHLRVASGSGGKSSLELFEVSNSINYGYEFEYNGDAVDALYLWSRGFSGNEGIRMTWEKNGEVGIGTTTPAYKLEVNGTAGKPGGGSWTATSDARLKQDVNEYKDGLKEILAIRPVTYRYNEQSGHNTEKEYVGVIAQELKEVAPYMVGTFELDGTEYYDVDNSPMMYMLINAVKELKAENDAQQQLIEQLLKERK